MKGEYSQFMEARNLTWVVVSTWCKQRPFFFQKFSASSPSPLRSFLVKIKKYLEFCEEPLILKIRNTLTILHMARPRNFAKHLEKKIISHFWNLWTRIALFVPFPFYSQTLALFKITRLYHLHISRHWLVSKLPYKLEQP